MEFSYFTRKKDLEDLESKQFDVLVVGGGIAGAGIANLLASNNLKVLLVEKGDFASGTSSNSSKLIHGGIRYLAQGHLFLTRELLKERDYLLKNSGIVEELKFDILIDKYSWSRTSLYFGIFLYNLLAGRLKIPTFKRGKFQYPGAKGHFEYTDAVTDDALLVVYNIVTSVMKGGVAINYAEVTGLEDTGDGVKATIRDRFESGEYLVESKLVINASGPWAGKIFKKYVKEEISNFKLSKGTHLIFRKRGIDLKNAIAFKSHIDGRQMFVIPRGEVIICGTTDEFVESPDELEVKEDEREYILYSVKRILKELNENEIIGEYTGVRPLYGFGSTPGSVTRDFYLKVNGKMITVMGVKITNYRNAAKKIAVDVGNLLGKRLETRDLPQIIYRRSGEEPLAIAVKNECALTADDVIRRRLGYYYFKEDQGRSKENAIKERLKDYLEGRGR